MMVVVPVNSDKGKAEDVGRERRNQGVQRPQIRAVGRPQFEHHDRDDHGDDAVAEGFEAPRFRREPNRSRPEVIHLQCRSLGAA
jgi:hypothetical protein